jgi:hypothetical protein
VRRVRTGSGVVAVQVVTRQGRETLRVDHVGSAHDDAGLELLVAAARERLHPGQDGFELGPIAQVASRVADVADWTKTVNARTGGCRTAARGGGGCTAGGYLVCHVVAGVDRCLYASWI